METNIVTSNNWETMKEQATALVKSGFLPPSINTPEKAIALAIAGKELGVGMMEAMRSINIIQGKPCVSPQLMLALAYRTGLVEEIKIDSNDERCIVTVTRKGKSPHSETFGVKEATDLGLIGKDNYKKQRATMLKWRALAANLRVTFPDVMLGLYTAEEMGAEVKVTESEGMEVVSQDELVNTGVRVPAGYWDLPTPEEKQARIGEGNQVRKTEKGWFIFTPKQSVEEFSASIVQKPEITQENANVSVSEPSKEGFITVMEQAELFRQVKSRGIHHNTFKKYLKDALNIDGTAKIQKKDYDSVYTWIIQHDSAEVGA